MVEALRVLHVAQPTTEGVAVMAAALVRDQVARGWDVAVACPPGGDLPGWALEAGARHLGWRATREPGLSVAGETRRLRHLVAQEGPALVHLHSSKAGLAGRLAVRGRRPTVFQPHAWSFLAVTGAQRRGATAWERFAVRWTDAVVAVSEAELEAGRSAGVRGLGVVIPNGIDLQAHPPADARERDRVRARLGIGPEPLAVCVGRVCRQKGQDLLLRAWPLVRAQVTAATCVLVGDGPDLEDVRAALPTGVQAVGRRDDVPDWLAAADVVVIPSRWEAGGSLVLLEAMARARAVVVSDVAGARSTTAGIVTPIPVDDVDALAARTAALLAAPAKATAAGAALARRAREFGMQRCGDEMAALYARLLRRD